MVWISRRMHERPNRVQTGVEVLFSLMRDNITRGNMDDSMAAKWFPFIGALFLFIWYCNLIGYIPLPTNSGETFDLFGAHIPDFALYAATANISVPLVLAIVVFFVFNWEGIRTQGPGGYLHSLIPSGVSGAILFLIFPLEIISTFMRLLSLTIRLFANILAGHMIILFMAGGLAVLLGLTFLGWFTMPFAVILYLFELGLVATLQAFIFATLAAIYIGGAVTHH
jgi:F-type H+-transporting ATPase subunit a